MRVNPNPNPNPNPNLTLTLLDHHLLALPGASPNLYSLYDAAMRAGAAALGRPIPPDDAVQVGKGSAGVAAQVGKGSAGDAVQVGMCARAHAWKSFCFTFKCVTCSYLVVQTLHPPTRVQFSKEVARATSWVDYCTAALPDACTPYYQADLPAPTLEFIFGLQFQVRVLMAWRPCPLHRHSSWLVAEHLLQQDACRQGTCCSTKGEGSAAPSWFPSHKPHTNCVQPLHHTTCPSCKLITHSWIWGIVVIPRTWLTARLRQLLIRLACPGLHSPPAVGLVWWGSAEAAPAFGQFEGPEWAELRLQPREATGACMHMRVCKCMCFCVCMCVHVRVCARVCARACVWVGAQAWCSIAFLIHAVRNTSTCVGWLPGGGTRMWHYWWRLPQESIVTMSPCHMYTDKRTLQARTLHMHAHIRTLTRTQSRANSLTHNTHTHTHTHTPWT